MKMCCLMTGGSSTWTLNLKISNYDFVEAEVLLFYCMPRINEDLGIVLVKEFHLLYLFF
jgi:hypothetical protein